MPDYKEEEYCGPDTKEDMGATLRRQKEDIDMVGYNKAGVLGQVQ